MLIPVDALLLVLAAVVLLLVVPWSLYMREHRRIVRLMTPAVPLVQIGQSSLELEASAPHDHIWTDQPIEIRDQWRIYGCLVPGCTNRDCRTGKA